MKYLFPLVFLMYLLFAMSCGRSDDFDTSSDVMLEFSVDTLRFDTVFTELGSATRILKLYNRRSKPIQISSISIKDDPNSFFRLNIDGIPTNTANEIEIAANDSLYIFGEVTIDPDMPLSQSPFVIEDEIHFEVNGNMQTVYLEAWGQNANYIPNRFSFGQQTLFLPTPPSPPIPGSKVYPCGDSFWTWDDEKPYVIYGTVAFFGCELTITPGTRIHVHGGLARQFDPIAMQNFFFNDGRFIMATGSTLKIEGTIDEPVIITGDRLEEPFQDVSGQWWGLLLSRGSSGHKIEHAEIKNSIVGAVVDSLVDLTINNSKIYNTSNVGLVGVHSGRVEANNCLFYDNGGNAVRMIEGGDYEFNHCTLASYGVDASALYMSNILCLDQLTCNPCQEYRLNALFRNSIIYGSRRDEVDLFDGDECDGVESNSPLNYKFRNCIVRVDELTTQAMGKYSDFFEHCDPCQNADGNAVLFFDPNDDDYHLDSLSIAENQGIPLTVGGVNLGIDLDGVARDGVEPDQGCYEYVQ